jgi:hypothetical protein
MVRFTRFLFLIVLVLGVAISGVSAQRGQRGGPPPRPMMLLSGTYDLESTRGDNAHQAADAATRDLPPIQRDRAYQDLLSRLQPPMTLAIEQVGRTVTISSSSAPRVTFDADGRDRDERFGDRHSSTRAEFIGNRLIVWSRGNRSTDFQVTFEPLDGGDSLLVTRQMDSDDLRRPVEIRSYYHRVSRDPRWDVYRDVDPRMGRRFMVPEGTQIVAVLDTALYSRTSRYGERFSMTVVSPGEFRDAYIDGFVARTTPYARGHNSELRIYFDRIRLRGQGSDFEGVLRTVRVPGGPTLSVAEARDDADRTDKTIESGTIGAALGAIIGAIAGGGKGAAIGAVIGGVGGVISAQDRDLDLPPGTEVMIIATGRIR